VQAQVVAHLAAQVGRQLGLEEGTHLVAESEVVAGIGQVHLVSFIMPAKKARPFKRLYPKSPAQKADEKKAAPTRGGLA
jgi:hypothetical protein